MLVENQKQVFSSQVQKALKDNELSYRKKSQIAYYSNLSSIEQKKIFAKSSYDVECNLVFCCYGERYQPDYKQALLYYIIRTLDEQIPNLKKMYSLAYTYHSLSDFLYFRSILQQLPFSYFSKLKSIYIVDAGFLVKAIQKLSFGIMNEFIQSKVVHLNNLEDVQQKKKVVLPSTKMNMQENIASIEAKVIQNKLYGKKLNQYKLSQRNIPIIIENLAFKLYSSTKYLSAEGIMRKSCNIQSLQQLQNHLMKDQTAIDHLLPEEDPYIVCGCLKKILNNLYVPLFSYAIYDKIIAYRSSGNEQDDVEFIVNCIKLMTEIQANVLAFIVGFLKKGIIRYEMQNKMSAYNLAVVFGPCFFRPKEYRVDDLINSGRFSKIVLLLIENYDKIFQEKGKEVEQTLESNKDIFA